jgi:hypothetical protein
VPISWFAVMQFFFFFGANQQGRPLLTLFNNYKEIFTDVGLQAPRKEEI